MTSNHEKISDKSGCDHLRSKIGPAGWSYQDWRGVVYPLNRDKNFDELEYVSRFFDAIEINSTFYRPPAPSISKSWVKRIQGNPAFVFTAKLWQQFTHQRGGISEAEISHFKKSIDPLVDDNRLGALLIQFPWSFKHSQETTQYLKNLFTSFNDYPLMAEFRHKSWQTQSIYKFLKDYHIGFVNIDQPVIGPSITPSSVLTSEIAYVRFHGRNYQNWFRKDAGRDARYDYLYTDFEMEEWIKDLQHLNFQAKKGFFIFNNHYKGQAAVNGLQLKARLSGEKVSVPEPLLTHYPNLQRIAKPTLGQTLSLF